MATAAIQAAKTISIHALREESDHFIALNAYKTKISIHALREESDNSAYRPVEVLSNFNPRSP